MTELAALEAKLDNMISRLDTTPQFSELKSAEFSEGFKDLAIMGAGGAISPIISNVINRFVGLGDLAPLVAGFALRTIVKNHTVQLVANGIIISSISKLVSNILQGRIGFSETREDDSISFSETRVGGVNFG